MPIEVGSRLGHYTVDALIGEGGMGRVYRATDTKLNRQVALKILPEAVASDHNREERFRREARVLASLNHPNIAQIYGFEDAGDTSALVLELVEGPTLAERIDDGPVPVDDLLTIATQITEALEAAHDANIVHRDLKPANVKITPRGQVKILDFGIAKWGQRSDDAANAATETMTQAGVVVGTVQYMSPEQLQGRPVDGRSDFFSLGVLLYEAIAGRHPFPADSQAERVSSILRDTPADLSELVPGYPADLDRILTRCLEKEPTKRFATARALQQALKDLNGDRVIQQQGAHTPTSGPAYRTPLIGRDPELAELEASLERVKAGTGSLVTLAGEPGVGKTRLSSELVSCARREGFLSLVGHCYEGEGTTPFSPWVEILETTARIAPRETLRALLGDAAPEVSKLLPSLRRVFPDIPPPLELDPESERHHLFLSFTEFVERSSRVQPSLLILEDLHWADDATLLLLQHLAPRLAEMPVMVVATYRDVELDVARPLAAALRQLTKDRLATRIALRRLPEGDVAAMLAALSGQEPAPSLVAAIHHETEGNPFFVEEVYEHLSEEGRLFDAAGNWRTDLTTDELDVPEGVRLVVGRRLERLSEEGRRALTVAAVIGRRFLYPLLESAADLDADTLLDGIEGAERLRLIEPDPDASAREPQYRFTHELIRQTLLGGLSMPRRQRLHVRVASALEQHYPDSLENHASMLAHHLYEAGAGADESKTIHFLTLAGDQAMESGGFEEARRSFDHGLSLEPGDRAVRASLLSRRGMAQRSLDQWDAAISDLTEALDLYDSEADRPAAVATCRELAHAYVWTQRPVESVEFSRKGLTWCGNDPPDRSRLLAYLGWALSNLGDFDPADAAVTESLELVTQVGDPRLEGRVLCTNWYYTLHSYQSPDGYTYASRAVECLRSAGDPAQLALALSYLHYSCVRTGRLNDLVPIEEETESLMRKGLGRLDLKIVALFMSHRAFLETADLSLFQKFTERWAKVSATMQAWGFLGEAWDAQVRMWQGEWPEARQVAERAIGREPHPSVHFGQCWGMLFLIECLLGNREQALALLDKNGRDLPQAGRFNGNGQWSALLRVVEGLEILGESARAAALYPLTVEAIGTGTAVSMDANHLLETVAGIAASAGTDWPAAQRHFDTALRQAEEIPFRIEQPEVRRWYAKMLLDRNEAGDRGKAQTLLGEATEMYRTIGMPKHVEMVEKMSAEVS